MKNFFRRKSPPYFRGETMKKYGPIRCFLLQTRLIYKRKNGLDTQWEGQNFVHFISDSTFGFGFKNEKEWFIFLTQLT